MHYLARLSELNSLRKSGNKNEIHSVELSDLMRVRALFR